MSACGDCRTRALEHAVPAMQTVPALLAIVAYRGDRPRMTAPQLCSEETPFMQTFS
jgi:hypothetical protein